MRSESHTATHQMYELERDIQQLSHLTEYLLQHFDALGSVHKFNHLRDPSPILGESQIVYHLNCAARCGCMNSFLNP